MDDDYKDSRGMDDAYKDSMMTTRARNLSSRGGLQGRDAQSGQLLFDSRRF